MSDDALVEWITDRFGNWFDFYKDYATYRRAFEQANPGQRALFCTCWLKWEVENGGFHQFFGNSTGMIGPDALAGYKLFGMDDAAKVIQSAFDFAKFDPYPRERKERVERMPDYDANNTRWHELDQAYYDAISDKTTANEYDRIVAARQAAYIRAHLDEFFNP